MKKKKDKKPNILSIRSTVGLGQNLGSIVMKSPKDYDRKKLKSDLRKQLDEE